MKFHKRISGVSQRSRLRVPKVICNLSNYWKWGLSQPCGPPLWIGPEWGCPGYNPDS